MGWGPESLITESFQVPSPARQEKFAQLVERRAQHEPVAYLVGQKEFWSLSLQVDARVLIPRPDTETLVEEVLSLFADSAPQRFVDVGCGSGCLVCALARSFGQAQAVAVDVEAGALALAAANVERLGLSARVDLRQGDLLAPLAGEQVDLICANLPYVPSEQLPALPLGVRGYEPMRALDGGPDGLDLVRRLIGQARHHLHPDGWLVLELGVGQAPAVRALCQEHGFCELRTRNDLGGIERVVAAQWPRNHV